MGPGFFSELGIEALVHATGCVGGHAPGDVAVSTFGLVRLDEQAGAVARGFDAVKVVVDHAEGARV